MFAVIQYLCVSFVAGMFVGFLLGTFFGMRALRWIAKNLREIFSKPDNTEQLNRIEKDTAQMRRDIESLKESKKSKDFFADDELPTRRL